MGEVNRKLWSLMDGFAAVNQREGTYETQPVPRWMPDRLAIGLRLQLPLPPQLHEKGQESAVADATVGLAATQAALTKLKRADNGDPVLLAVLTGFAAALLKGATGETPIKANPLTAGLIVFLLALLVLYSVTRPLRWQVMNLAEIVKLWEAVATQASGNVSVTTPKGQMDKAPDIPRYTRLSAPQTSTWLFVLGLVPAGVGSVVYGAHLVASAGIGDLASVVRLMLVATCGLLGLAALVWAKNHRERKSMGKWRGRVLIWISFTPLLVAGIFGYLQVRYLIERNEIYGAFGVASALIFVTLVAIFVVAGIRGANRLFGLFSGAALVAYLVAYTTLPDGQAVLLGVALIVLGMAAGAWGISYGMGAAHASGGGDGRGASQS